MTKMADFEGYCLKCRAKRMVKNVESKMTKNGKKMKMGECEKCGTRVARFLKKSD